MVLFEIFMILALLRSASAYYCDDSHKGPCRKTKQCVPIVTPKNPTHLLVDWETILEEGCEQKYIQEIKIVVVEEVYKEKLRQFLPTRKALLLKRIPVNHT